MIKMASMRFVWLFILTAHAAGLFNKQSSSVTELMAAEFQQRVIVKDELWLVMFYSHQCPHCVNMVPEFEKAATIMKGIFNLGGVDTNANEQLSRKYAQQGVPTILLFNAEQQPLDYNGERNAAEIVKFVRTNADQLINRRLGIKADDRKTEDQKNNEETAGQIVVLTDNSFDVKMKEHADKFWLVEFYAPWCGHCKNLEPAWRKAAALLKGKAFVAALDATVHHTVTSRFNIQGFPTIKAFRPNDHENPIEYEGPRDAKGIADWVTSQLTETVEPPRLIELTSNDELEIATQKTMCVVAFLPHLIDCQTECRNKYLNMLKEVANDFKRNGWGWLWTVGMTYTELEAIVGVGGFGYPALVVISRKKDVYGILRGQFSKPGVNAFLRDLSHGRLPTTPLGKNLPHLKDETMWDGKDYKDEDEEDVKSEL